MSKQFDVCIRGGGVVGRSLALLLARERLRVALVIRPTVPETALPASTPAGQSSSTSAGDKADVRAYALNTASKTMLEGLRAWPDAPAVTAVNDMQVWGDDSTRLDFSAKLLEDSALAWIVDVPALEQQLSQAVRYQPQIETVDAPVKAALQVVCEGQKSSSRNEFGATWTVKPYPQKAVAARLVSDQPHQGVARQWFHKGEILALLPVSSADPVIAGNCLALIWSVATERAEVLQKMPDDEFCTALEAVCGEVPGKLNLTSERASWALALSNADRWVGPGWALAGDAAHTVHPLAGQGLNLGLADAQALAGVLAQREYWRKLGDERLLRRYERARKADIAAMGAMTDGLHNLFSQGSGYSQSLRGLGMRGVSQSGLLKSWLMRRAAGLL